MLARHSPARAAHWLTSVRYRRVQCSGSEFTNWRAWLVRRLVVTITDCRPAASPSAFYRLDLGDFWRDSLSLSWQLNSLRLSGVSSTHARTECSLLPATYGRIFCRKWMMTALSRRVAITTKVSPDFYRCFLTLFVEPGLDGWDTCRDCGRHVTLWQHMTFTRTQ